jgi:hypothetical protein
LGLSGRPWCLNGHPCRICWKMSLVGSEELNRETLRISFSGPDLVQSLLKMFLMKIWMCWHIFCSITFFVLSFSLCWHIFCAVTFFVLAPSLCWHFLCSITFFVLTQFLYYYCPCLTHFLFCHFLCCHFFCAGTFFVLSLFLCGKSFSQHPACFEGVESTQVLFVFRLEFTISKTLFLSCNVQSCIYLH